MTKVNRDSADWRKVEQYIKARIDEIHLSMEKPYQPHNQTDIDRGMILFAREILSLANPLPAAAEEGAAEYGLGDDTQSY